MVWNNTFVRCGEFRGAVVTQLSGNRRVLYKLRRVYGTRGVGLTDVTTLNTIGSFAINIFGASRGGCCSGDFSNAFRVISLANAIDAVGNRCCTRLRVDTNGSGNRIFNNRLGGTMVDTAYRVIVAIVGNDISHDFDSSIKLGLFSFGGW